MKTVIKTEDLTIRFGSFIAVNKVNLQIKEGEIYGFLGPNGSGKSTVIRTLCGLLKPAFGRCLVLGCDVLRQATDIKQQIGYMSQKFSLYPELTVMENLQFYAGLYGVPTSVRQEKIMQALKWNNLQGKENIMVGALSAGVRQRLALASAILHKPKILFLDEPTSGVDPASRRLFWKIIYWLSGEGTTILITTHFMDEVEHCDTVGFIDAGRLVASGSPRQLKNGIDGTLVNIACADSHKLLAQIKEREIPFQDAYIYGKNLRLLMRKEDVTLLKEFPYKIITPSMEDVFAYYARLKGGTGLCTGS